jgi:hypothetical protein
MRKLKEYLRSPRHLRLFNFALFTHFSVSQFCAGRVAREATYATVLPREKREQYAAQENYVSRNKAERIKFNYLPDTTCR